MIYLPNNLFNKHYIKKSLYFSNKGIKKLFWIISNKCIILSRDVWQCQTYAMQYERIFRRVGISHHYGGFYPPYSEHSP